jgi:hypothetical protein
MLVATGCAELAPVICAVTSSPTLMPDGPRTPVNVVDPVIAAVNAWPWPVSVIEVALMAVTLPPRNRSSPPPCGWGGGRRWKALPRGSQIALCMQIIAASMLPAGLATQPPEPEEADPAQDDGDG